MEYRTGLGYDIHRLAEGLELTLGGVKIPHTKGCVAHSDGDVVLHALCDALLGSLALGDIGQHFPDTSDEFKGIDSRILLSRVIKMVADKGWHLVNADIMLLMQQPRIAPYIPQMREEIASTAGCDVDCISIKATTTEGLGPIGCEEGAAAFATVTVAR
ncbi:MAG: 2-C-methyl-D-erythritol 2,4-cyclodiphosphate synthase [Bacteroidales bacterium]|nr:2-C-methyl-D-erythritol 2,4-cyclodiphosphate synthase [Bacteroidales bacterium]MBR5055627.1 2-C-methyl-D-erythritol 2,4-cyclodiphosphate synthase [Bacteroidales bacterium]